MKQNNCLALTAQPKAIELKILNASLQIANEMGISALKVSEICRVAGVSRPSFYKYFATIEAFKERLFLFLCSEFDNEIYKLIEDNPEPESRGDLLAEHLGNRLLGHGPQLSNLAHAEIGKGRVEIIYEGRRLAVEHALKPFFELSETITGIKVDHSLAADFVTRHYVSLSEHRNAVFPSNPVESLRKLIRALTHMN